MVYLFAAPNDLPTGERLGYVVMATSAEIEREVRQLDNDVQSIYELWPQSVPRTSGRATG